MNNSIIKAAILNGLLLVSTLYLPSAFAADIESTNESTVIGEEGPYPYPYPFPGCRFREATIEITDPASSEPRPIVMYPDQNYTWTIENTSKHATAHRVKAYFDPDIEDYLEVNNGDCREVRKGESCEIFVTVKPESQVESVEATIVEFYGCNTNTVEDEVELQISEALVIGGEAPFCFLVAQPGTQQLSLTNNTSDPIFINASAITFSGVANVTLGTLDASNCAFDSITGQITVPAAPNNTCTIPVVATQSSYNTGDENGVVNIIYSIDDNAQTAQGCITVENTTILINDGDDIEISTGDPITKYVDVVNVGRFDWQNPLVTYDAGDITGLTVTIPDSCGLGTGSISANGGLCTVTLESDHNTSFTGTGSLNAVHSLTDNINIVTTEQPILVGAVNIALGTNNFLQYSEIVISNVSAGGDVFLEGVGFSNNLANEIQICEEDSTTCLYTSTCEFEEPIAEGESCTLVVSSIVDNGDDNESPKSITGEFSVTVSNTTLNNEESEDWTADFTLTKDVSVYATGLFDFAGNNDVPASSIARWNSIGWEPLDTGLNDGIGNALAIYQGNLIVGGSFSGAGSVSNTGFLAVWNGTEWAPLGTSSFMPVNNPVNTLRVDLDIVDIDDPELLYIGGEFTGISANSFLFPIPTGHIAVWDGSSLIPLGNAEGSGADASVNAITAYSNGLVFGGDFNRVNPGNVRAHHVALWDGGEWERLGNTVLFNGVNRDVNALFRDDLNLYVGGEFTKTIIEPYNRPFPTLFARHIARWDGDQWNQVGENPRAINDTVNTITSFQNNIYVGGEFNHRRNGPNYVAKLTGADEWRQVGVSLNGPVNTLYPNGDSLYAGGIFGTTGLLNSIAVFTLDDFCDEDCPWVSVDGGVTMQNPMLEPEVNSILVASSITMTPN